MLVGRPSILAMLALLVGSCATVPTAGSVSPLVGTWSLQNRIDRQADGREFIEPSLGRDPIALLIYDSKGNVSAQLMRRDRSQPERQALTNADPNNSAAQGGYDAYFGTYFVSGNTVTHVLHAALNSKDVGRRLTRNFRLESGRLVIYYAAREADGTQVTRTLTWQRSAP